MKLSQYHLSGFAIYEITEVSLKISSLRGLLWQKNEISFENIQIDRKYELQEDNSSVLAPLGIFAFIFFFFAFEAFTQDVYPWTGLIITGLPMLICISLFFFPKTKIHIPVQAQGLIRMYKSKPDKKTVEEFLYNLEGKILLFRKKKKNKMI